MNIDEIQARVQQGSNWLLGLDPWWFSKVTMPIDVGHERFGVFEQFFGGNTLTVMFDYDLDHGDLVDRGFSEPIPAEPGHRQALNDAWADKLARTRNASIVLHTGLPEGHPHRIPVQSSL